MKQLELFQEPVLLSDLIYACEQYVEAEREDMVYKQECSFRDHMLAKEQLLSFVDTINQEGINNDIGGVGWVS
jgi:hypothetical protein